MAHPAGGGSGLLPKVTQWQADYTACHWILEK